MIRIVTYEELCYYIRNLTEDISKTILDAIEEMKKLIDELIAIPEEAEEKESYPKNSFHVCLMVRIMHNKRLWKRQKIP